MLSIKQNVMAMQVARNLGLAYDSLGKSINRLSSGLRIQTAADDAAGLAVRELMRADIAGLGQGKRNAMDGVSMLQTAEAGVGQVDQLLIRMRELAEQASTGTYTDAQKRIMQNEFDSLTDEINRIAAQMDFNGINLLNNSDSVRISIGDGPNNRGKFIEVVSQDMSAASLRVGGEKSRVENKDDSAVATQDENFIDFGTVTQSITNSTQAVSEGLKFSFSGGTYIGFGATLGTTQLVTVTSMSITVDSSTAVGTITTTASGVAYHIGTGNKSLAQVVSAVNSAAAQYATATSQTQFDAWAPAKAYFNATVNRYYLDVNQSVNGTWDVDGNFSGAKEVIQGSSNSGVAASTSDYIQFFSGTNGGNLAFTFGSGSYSTISHSATLGQTTATVTYGSFTVTISGTDAAAITGGTTTRAVQVGLAGGTNALSLDTLAGYINSAAQAFAGSATAEYTAGTSLTVASAFQNSSGQFVLDVRGAYDGNITLAAGASGTLVSSVAVGAGTTFAFTASTDGFGGGTVGADIRFAYSISNSTPTNGSAMAIGDWAETHGNGFTIDLVNQACPAVTAIDTAINTKDAYRAYLGYTMNRLSSVADTLDVQMLQLQGAESRISDVDVATETAVMTRNLVLAQAGVSMLSMANGLPQMALSLLGG